MTLIDRFDAQGQSHPKRHVGTVSNAREGMPNVICFESFLLMVAEIMNVELEEVMRWISECELKSIKLTCFAGRIHEKLGSIQRSNRTRLPVFRSPFWVSVCLGSPLPAKVRVPLALLSLSLT